MRKHMIVMAVAFLCSPAVGAYAGTTDTGPGCGLGKLAWGESSSNKHILQQVLIATTNGSFGSQTFGISFGTSGCTNDGVFVKEQKINVFASLNFDNLSQEMAQGQGEHLASLATLLGVPAEHHAAFFALTQDRYTTLIQGGEKESVALLTALQSAMDAHPVLAKVSMNR